MVLALPGAFSAQPPLKKDPSIFGDVDACAFRAPLRRRLAWPPRFRALQPVNRSGRVRLVSSISSVSRQCVRPGGARLSLALARAPAGSASTGSPAEPELQLFTSPKPGGSADGTTIGCLNPPQPLCRPYTAA